MSLESDYRLVYQSPLLRHRAFAACVRTAYQIVAEPKATTNNALRLKWAKSVLRSPESLLNNVMWALALDPVIAKEGEKVKDDEILRVVSENVNKGGILLAE